MLKIDLRSTVIRFILLVGIVNLFADFTYEGARSLNGAFLGSLGASAVAVGVIAGLGELAGYGLRSVAGLIADKTGQYWLVILAGYTLNMLAVPALALAGSWPAAAALIVAERTGRAIRKPAVDALLASAAQEVGRGSVFGLNEALDQGGATVGPLLVALMISIKGNYRVGFAVLLVSALLCLGTLFYTRSAHPRPIEPEQPGAREPSARFSRTFWLYLAAGGLIAAGFVDFALIAFHFQQTAIIPGPWIPDYYAVAMGIGAIGAFFFGRWFDRAGFPILIGVFLFSAFFAPLIFFGNALLALLGMILWGVGMAAQESLLKALVAERLPRGKRSTAFGLYDAGFGLAWFAGSALMGFLYSRALLAMVLFSVFAQLAALPVFLYTRAHLQIPGRMNDEPF